ncbi:recombinase family protein [Paenibacillus sp. S-38]|uniref:recombinase family protein n=1 Tax=Paenibacillus sp. S-38 TaxID=3416710 RepID=UPI003CF1AC8C
MNGKKFVVGLYIRVSTDKQANEGYSLEAQEEVTLDAARRRFGSDVNFEVYVDEGKSAKNTKKRSELNRMMRDVREGRLAAIITFKVSRLSRSLADSLKLVDQIRQAGAFFISVKEGEYGTPHGNLQFNILSSVAQYQREDLAENVQLGMTQRAKEGFWNGGQVLGYRSVDKQLFIHPPEATVIRIIFEKFVLENWGTKKISNYVNENGFRSKNGNPFSPDSIIRVLGNPVYKGYVRFNQVIGWEENRRKGKNPNPIICKGVHEAIIDEAMWDEAAILLAKRSTGVPRQYTGNFPLTGLSKCPECGGYMTSAYGSRRKDGTKKRYYVCGAYHNHGKSICSSNSICAEWLENQVFDRLKSVLQSDSIIAEITNRINLQLKEKFSEKQNPSEIQALESRLRDLETRKKKVQSALESHDESIYTIQEAKDRLTELRNAIHNIKMSIQQHYAESVRNEDMPLESVSTELIRLQLHDFIELSSLLDPLEFRKLLAASIEKIEASKKELHNITFSFIVHLQENELDPLDPIHTFYMPASLLIRAFYLQQNQNHHLFVIRFTANDLKLSCSPVNVMKLPIV